jgi:hypothetical protein
VNLNREPLGTEWILIYLQVKKMEEIATKTEVKTTEKTGCTIRVRGKEIHFDHPPTSGDIEDLGFKHIGGKFHVYNENGTVVRKSEFPYQGKTLELREYHAPAIQVFVALNEDEMGAVINDEPKDEKVSKKIRNIIREHYKLGE